MRPVNASAVFWRIGVDAPHYTAEDASGEGARRTGGRWNREGRPVVYASSSIALACLETIAHKNQSALPLNRYLIKIEVPIELWRARTVFDAASHVGWDAIPAGKVSLDAGDAWLRAGSSVILEVPSVIIPEESNYLLNPLHPDMQLLTFSKVRKWLYDVRVWK